MTSVGPLEPRPQQRRSDALEILLAPCSATEFAQRYFEREPLHVRRGDRTIFVRSTMSPSSKARSSPAHFSTISSV